MLKTANRRHFRVVPLSAAICGLIAGYFAFQTAGLSRQRDALLLKLASMMAHESIDGEDRSVVGDVTVSSAGGTQYHAAGRVMIGQQLSNWTFTFFNDLDVPTVPVDVHIRAITMRPTTSSGQTISEPN